MTIPKKTSRITTIEGVRYRWTVSRQTFDSSTVRLTFLAHEDPSCNPPPRSRHVPHSKLRATFNERHCDSVTPALAEALIRGGLKRRWDPRGAKDHNIGPLTAIKLLCV
jgi:hypothetical protein